MRKRGASGGRTVWSGAPQLPQISCGESPTRSQCPRAAHSGFKHCTVQPGEYCIGPHALQNFRASSGKGKHLAAEAHLQQTTPRGTGELCARRTSVSRKIDTISRGTVSEGCGSRSVREFVRVGRIADYCLAAPPLAVSLACSSSIFFCWSATSCCFAAISFCSPFSRAAPSLSES